MVSASAHRDTMVRDTRIQARNLWRAGVVGVLWSIPRLIAVAGILTLEWQRTCDRPLRWWLLVLVLVDFVRIPLRVHTLVVLRRLKVDFDTFTPEYETGFDKLLCSPIYQVGRVLSYAVLVWYAVGVYWLFASERCAVSSPVLYTLVFVLLVILFVFLGINLLCGFVYVVLVAMLKICGSYFEATDDDPEAQRGTPEEVSDKFEDITYEDGVTSDPQCCICLCEYEQCENLKQLPCKHVFHAECITTWLKASVRCPLCNFSMVEQEVSSKSAEPAPPTPADQVEMVIVQDALGESPLANAEEPPVYGTITGGDESSTHAALIDTLNEPLRAPLQSLSSTFQCPDVHVPLSSVIHADFDRPEVQYERSCRALSNLMVLQTPRPFNRVDTNGTGSSDTASQNSSARSAHTCSTCGSMGGEIRACTCMVTSESQNSSIRIRHVSPASSPCHSPMSTPTRTRPTRTLSTLSLGASPTPHTHVG